MTPDEDLMRAIALTLIDGRALGATVCPSEVARAFAAEFENAGRGATDWRDAMPLVHAAVDQMVAERM